MPPVPIWPSLLGVGINALSGLFGNYMNNSYLEEANKYNADVQMQINEQNIQAQRDINQENIKQQWDMWNATNEYNSPAAQMARYREAGLNPNLIYGQSNTTSPVSVGVSKAPVSQAHQKQAKQFQNLLQGLDISSMYSLAVKQRAEADSVILDNEIKRSSLEDLKKQAGLSNELVAQQISSIAKDVELKGLDVTFKQLSNTIKKFEVDELPTLKRLNENRLSLSNSQVDLIPIIRAKEEAGLKLAKAEIALSYQRHALLRAQTSHELAKIGVTRVQKDSILKEIEVMEEKIKNYQMKLSLGEQDQLIKSQIYIDKVLDNTNPFSDIPVLKGIGTLIQKPIYYAGKAIESLF